MSMTERLAAELSYGLPRTGRFSPKLYTVVPRVCGIACCLVGFVLALTGLVILAHAEGRRVYLRRSLFLNTKESGYGSENGLMARDSTLNIGDAEHTRQQLTILRRSI